MSSIVFAHETDVVRRRGLVLVVGILLAAVVGKAAMAQPPEKYSGFINWPPELASRAPELSNRIAHDIGEQPHSIKFGGRDTMEIVLWNPAFWRNGVQSKELPMETLPQVSVEAKQVARIVWTTFERDAGINVVQTRFVRARTLNYLGVMSREVPAQELFVTFTREDFDAGLRSEPGIGISQREGGSSLSLYADQSAGAGARDRVDTTKIESSGAPIERGIRQAGFVRGPSALAPKGFALVDTIERAFGERPREIAFTGKDTLDVTFWNPAFWSSDMQSRQFPQATLPLVRQAAEHVGGLVWTTYGRDAGINVIRITFVRMRRVSTTLMTRQVPVQEVTGELRRKQLETGAPRLVSLTMTQR